MKKPLLISIALSFFLVAVPAYASNTPPSNQCHHFFGFNLCLPEKPKYPKPFPKPTKPVPTPNKSYSVDLVDFQSTRDGLWFSEDISSLPKTTQTPAATFDIQNSVVSNRKNGQLKPSLVAGYFFVQWDISKEAFATYADTIGALYIKSALMSFVDYPNNRVLWWDRKSTEIPTDIRGIIKVCNKRHIPVYLELNYSDYIPGPVGTGVESLEKVDNISNTISYIKSLRKQGLSIEGVTFGDEIEDESGYGQFKPTIYNTDLTGRFISYATALKSAFPGIKIYAFDSYIFAPRGELSKYWDLFQKVRAAEVASDKNLIDGFNYRESYVYMNDLGQVLDSQFISDDLESIYRDTPVYRYDTIGVSYPNADRDYLHTLLNKTAEIFGRQIDIGLTEYLPAGPYQLSETDTSKYADMDFILHYSDLVGIYGQLGLDVTSKIMFADSLNMHKGYFDRDGHKGINYPVHEQLAKYFNGDLLNIVRSVDYDTLKIKMYASRKDNRYFAMILNKNVNDEAAIKVTLPDKSDLVIRLPRRSYTSLLVDGKKLTVSGIGN